MFDVAKIVIEFLERAGIDPAQLKAQIDQFVANGEAVRAEVAAAKNGFVAAVQHFDARLKRIEMLLEALQPETKPNGIGRNPIAIEHRPDGSVATDQPNAGADIDAG